MEAGPEHSYWWAYRATRTEWSWAQSPVNTGRLLSSELGLGWEPQGLGVGDEVLYRAGELEQGLEAGWPGWEPGGGNGS